MREALAAVKAQIRDDDALKAEVWELAENLHRCDLTKEQRDEHIRRYGEVLELRAVQSAPVVPIDRSAGRNCPASCGTNAAEIAKGKVNLPLH